MNDLTEQNAILKQENAKLYKQAENADEILSHHEAYIAELETQLIKAKQAMSQALSFLACMDRISDTEPNEQLAFDVLRKCLEELDK